MKAKLFILALTTIVWAGCSKDQYTTKPQLTFKSVNASSFRQNDLVTFKIDFTDKEGDVQDTLWFQKISLRCDGNYIQPYQVPDFPATKDLKGEFDLTFQYGSFTSDIPVITSCSNLPGNVPGDSCIFKFWLKDKAKNVSDTVSSPVIVLLK